MRAAAASPTLIQSTAGRFDIAAVDPTAAHGVALLAEESWRTLSGPLGLPDGFASPIFVRIGPTADAASDPSRISVEAPGIVSVRLGLEVNAGVTRRVLVRALLMRLAVDRHGVGRRLTVPLWLEHAGAHWIESRTNPAGLDALKYISARTLPVALADLLAWERGDGESPARSVAAFWLFTFLQSESGRAREWPSFLTRLLGGEEPSAALAAGFPGRFTSVEERELWWQTGWHHLRRLPTVPTLEADDSREQLGALARFVFADAGSDSDMVVPLPAVLHRSDEMVVRAELTRRAAALAKLLSNLHPFYRNAGLSLAEAFTAAGARPDRRDAACTAFSRDWSEALELEATTRAALDRLENGR